MNFIFANLDTILTIVVMGFLSWYLAKESKEAPKVDTGKKILRVSMLIEIIGWIGLSLTTIVLIGTLQSSPESIGGSFTRFWVIGLMVSFLVVGITLILTRHNSMTIFDEEKIEHYNLFRHKKTMQWQDIRMVNFSSLSQILYLRDGKQKMAIPAYSVGFQSFIDILKIKLNTLVSKKTLKEIRRS